MGHRGLEKLEGNLGGFGIFGHACTKASIRSVGCPGCVNAACECSFSRDDLCKYSIDCRVASGC